MLLVGWLIGLLVGWLVCAWCLRAEYLVVTCICLFRVFLVLFVLLLFGHDPCTRGGFLFLLLLIFNVVLFIVSTPEIVRISFVPNGTTTGFFRAVPPVSTTCAQKPA